MTRITFWLMRRSDRIVPSSSDETLQLIGPASFHLARRSFDELGLAMIWGGFTIVGMLVMLGLTAAGRAISGAIGQAGFHVGLGLSWFAFTGVCIHGLRFLLAEYAERAVERNYLRRSGRSSSKDAAFGQAVTPSSPKLVMALTRSTDWDLLVQGVVAMAFTLVTR